MLHLFFSPLAVQKTTHWPCASSLPVASEALTLPAPSNKTSSLYTEHQYVRFLIFCSLCWGKKKSIKQKTRQRKDGSCRKHTMPALQPLLQLGAGLLSSPGLCSFRQPLFLYHDKTHRPQWDSEHGETQPDAEVCSLTQLARDWQATATFLVPAEMPLGVSPPQTHIQFTLCLITPQYKWTAATRNYPVLTLEMILVNFFLPHSDMVWTN